MEGIEGGSSRWKNLRERLGLKGISCCGATWGSSASNMNVREEEYNDENYHHVHQPHEQEEIESAGQFPEHNALDPVCVGQIPATSGMNLATALAVERHFRASAQEWDPTNSAVVPTTTTRTPGTPLRISLMRLLEEGDSIVDGGQEEREEKESGDGMCCVCMGRKKGAAFIPCGHTFCRVCSRELWLNRGSCPLCNRAILETLDIF